MIDKVIHYCWFGRNPMPDLAKKCLESWKKFCPDYEIREWNEDNFDFTMCPYTKEAYENKKWAFVTDFVRLYVLYHFGGIYMDTDVEVIKPIDPYLIENEDSVPTGIMAAEKGNPFIGALLKDYDGRHFVMADGTLDMSTNVVTITHLAVEHGLKLNDTYQEIDGFTFYPHDYFCPKDCRTLKIKTTENTVTIHHFMGSWGNQKSRKIKDFLKHLLGERISIYLSKIKKKYRNKRFEKQRKKEKKNRANEEKQDSNA